MKIPQTLVLLLMGLGVSSPILNAQTSSWTRQSQPICLIEQEPVNPYGLAMAILQSLSNARKPVDDAQSEFKAAGSKPGIENLTGMMLAQKLATNDFICAERAVQPFTNATALSSSPPDKRKKISLAASTAVLAFDAQISLDDRSLELLS